jgi:hypothetical protein
MSDHRSSRPLQVSKSFSRLEVPTLDPLAQHRAASIVESPAPELIESPPDGSRVGNGDIFEQDDSEDGRMDGTSSTQANESAPAGLEELPIELVSLTDR